MTGTNHSEYAVRCQGVSKTYGSGANRVMALRGVDLDIPRGQLTMLVGPSGCGKTTLISIISTLLAPDDGRCEVLGRDLAELDPAAQRRFRGRTIGFVFQAFNLLPALSAAENVAVPLLIDRQPRDKALAAAHRALDSVGLGDRADALPSQLSGGQQQRVAIARALVHDPGVIVCDEPTSSLDHHTGQEMMRVLRDATTARDRTLIVVTHDNRIQGFADGYARMDDGQVVETGSGGDWGGLS